MLACIGLFYVLIKTTGQLSQNLSTDIPLPTITMQLSPTPTATLAPTGSFTIEAKLSADRWMAYRFSYGKYAVSFDQISDLGERVGGDLTYTEIYQVNPDFKDRYHLIGISMTVNPPNGSQLLWRKISYGLNGDQVTEQNMAYVLDSQGNRYDLGITCQKSLESCGGLADSFMPGYAVFDRDSSIVMVFAVPNDLDEFTLYTTWEYNDMSQ